MNIASVIKLYLRRLPEPLLSYELYTEWLRIGISSKEGNDEESEKELQNDGKNDKEILENQTKEEEKGHVLSLIYLLKQLVQRLPLPNLQTLRFLALHLNRVTW